MFLMLQRHIDQTKNGEKTQTRRVISYYKKGPKKGEQVPFKKIGSLQQVKTSFFARAQCTIRILDRWKERLGDISINDSWAEGGYAPFEYIEGLIAMHKGKIDADTVLVCYEYELVEDVKK